MIKTFQYKIDSSNTVFITYYPSLDTYVLNAPKSTQRVDSKESLIEELHIYAPEIVDEVELDLAEYFLLGE